MAMFNKNSIFFVDIQGHRGYNGEYIYKELAIINLSETFLLHNIYKPPYDSNSRIIDNKYWKANKWLEHHFHHFNWTNGICGYNTIVRDMREILPHNPTQIYVKGEEKIKFVKNLLMYSVDNKYLDERKYDTIIGIPVIDLGSDTHKAPNLKTLKNLYKSVVQYDSIEDKKKFCLYHNSFNCALLNVLLLRYFYLLNILSKNLNQSDDDYGDNMNNRKGKRQRTKENFQIPTQPETPWFPTTT